MKRRSKTKPFLGGIVTTIIAAWALQAPPTKGQEPEDWCLTYDEWVATEGDPTASAQGVCPTLGQCDEPAVRDAWIPGPSTPVVTIRIKFNIFCEDDGTNCTSSPSGVAAQMTQLNSHYAPHGIQFTAQSEYIHSTFYRNWSGGKDRLMRLTHKDDPFHQLNVYVIHHVNAIGKGTFPWSPHALGILGGTLIAGSAFVEGQRILTHEVGHNLGLWHTHHGVSEVAACSACYERADGEDADVTGDFAADTPPTPVNHTCTDPTGSDTCSVPPTSWAPTQLENHMGYAPESCRTLFTSQQAGRMHCWITDALKSWIVCASDADCDDGDECTQDDCIDTVCHNVVDCEDVNCFERPACRCDDNGGNSPLVCVNWNQPIPPEAGTDYVFITTDPINPSIELRTGNDGWVVWSQVNRTDDTPANLGNITIDPTLSTANFGLTLASISFLQGAANVASIALVDVGWTGQSNLGFSGITGELTGDLILQANASGNGGMLDTFVVPVLSGNITAKVIDRLNIGQASGSITAEEVTGDVNIDQFSGAMSISGDVSSTGRIIVEGELNGSLEVLGTFRGELCAANLSGGKPLPPNIGLQSIASGASVCEVDAAFCSVLYNAWGAEPGPIEVEKNRFISLTPRTNSQPTAIAVNLDSLHHTDSPPNAPDLSGYEEQLRWVNAFRDAQGQPVFSCPDALGPSYQCATLGTEPEYYDWASEIGSTAVLHITAAEIAPSSRYNASKLGESCAENWAAFSRGIFVETALWGDISGSEGAPDGFANVLDISAIVDTLKGEPSALPEFRALVWDRCLAPVAFQVNVVDLSRIVDAAGFEVPYPFSVEICE